MPELPEVETTKKRLKEKIKGQTVAKIVVREKKQFSGRPKEVEGKKIINLERKGKLLALALDDGRFLLIHLKLTGQLVFAANLKNHRAVFPAPIPFAGGTSLPGRSTRIIIFFKNDGALFFNDLRKFGWMRLVEKEEKERQFSLLGVEPLASDFTPEKLASLLASSRRPVKLVLMDQKKIAGLGNIYTNEALFTAGISPLRPARSLTPREIKALFKAIVKVVKEGIALGGTSAADDAYIQPNGRPGRFQNKLQVYQREGKPCPRCGRPIKKIKIGGRGTFYCPHCQK